MARRLLCTGSYRDMGRLETLEFANRSRAHVLRRCGGAPFVFLRRLTSYLRCYTIEVVSDTMCVVEGGRDGEAAVVYLILFVTWVDLKTRRFVSRSRAHVLRRCGGALFLFLRRLTSYLRYYTIEVPHLG